MRVSMTSKQPNSAEADSTHSVSGIEELVILYYDTLVHLATATRTILSTKLESKTLQLEGFVLK
jgi:hypothetical protein